MDIKKDGDKNLITIKSDNSISTYALIIDNKLPNKYEYQLVEGEEITFKLGKNEPESFLDKMISDPLKIYYIDGSFSYNQYLIKIPNNIGSYSIDELSLYDWKNIDIRSESMGPERKMNSVQYKTFKEIEEDYDIIFNDDGCGEAADLVAIKSSSDEIVLSLFHCKFSGSEKSGARLSDLYEVCGQAQRSIRWKHVGFQYLYDHIRNRENLWRNRDNSRFLKGNMSTLVAIKNMARTKPINLKVTIVQPGISKTKITEEMLKLLGAVSLYLTKTAQADLQVIVSE